MENYAVFRMVAFELGEYYEQMSHWLTEEDAIKFLERNRQGYPDDFLRIFIRTEH